MITIKIKGKAFLLIPQQVLNTLNSASINSPIKLNFSILGESLSVQWGHHVSGLVVDGWLTADELDKITLGVSYRYRWINSEDIDIKALASAIDQLVYRFVEANKELESSLENADNSGIEVYRA